jgi:hypothetical protein
MNEYYSLGGYAKLTHWGYYEQPRRVVVNSIDDARRFLEYAYEKYPGKYPPPDMPEDELMYRFVRTIYSEKEKPCWPDKNCFIG